jgi:hypothetical protein
MLATVWNPRRFRLIKVLENGRKFNAGDYIAEILEPLSQWRSIEAAGNERKLLVRSDNAIPHTDKLSTQYSNENQMKSRPHSPCFPDPAPSDFYLFGYVKGCLAGLSFEDADQLLAPVEGILEGIDKLTLQAVFLEWMDRLRKCIAASVEYTESAQINVIEEWSFILPILRCLCPGGTPCMIELGFESAQPEQLFNFYWNRFRKIVAEAVMWIDPTRRRHYIWHHQRPSRRSDISTFQDLCLQSAFSWVHSTSTKLSRNSAALSGSGTCD